MTQQVSICVTLLTGLKTDSVVILTVYPLVALVRD